MPKIAHYLTRIGRHRFFGTKISVLRGRFENRNDTRLWYFLRIKYLTTQSGLENRFTG